MNKATQKFSVLIDSANKDLYICFLDQNTIIKKYFFENLKKKVEEIISVFQDFIKSYNYSLKFLEIIYLNLGPGSFTGARIALVFARTIFQMNESIKLKTIDSLTWINLDRSGNEKICLDARSNEFYCASFKNFQIDLPIILEEKQNNNFKDYYIFENNVEKQLSFFKEEENALKIQVNYVKNPQIGGI